MNPPEGYRLMKKEDYTLTEEEMIKAKDLHFSICMDSDIYSEVIGRRVFSCGVCYQCNGGYPIGGKGEIYVNDITGDTHVRIFKYNKHLKIKK